MDVVAVLEHELKHAQCAVLAGVPDVEVGICRYLKQNREEKKKSQTNEQKQSSLINILTT